MPWSAAQSVEVNSFGVVNLILSQPHTRSKLFGWYLRPFGLDRAIQLSPYVEDWHTSALLQEIRRYAPNITFPAEVAERPQVQLRYRASSLGIYYLVCLCVLPFLGRFGVSLVPESLVREIVARTGTLIWDTAIAGFLGAIVCGGARLFSYDLWLRSHTEKVAQQAAA